MASSVQTPFENCALSDPFANWKFANLDCSTSKISSCFCYCWCIFQPKISIFASGRLGSLPEGLIIHSLNQCCRDSSPFPSDCLWGMMRIWLMWMKIRIMPMMETLLIVIIIMMMMTLTDPYTLASASLFSSLNPWYIILQGGPFCTNLPRRGSGAVLPWGVVRHLSDEGWHDEMMIAVAHDTISVKYDIKEIIYIINHPSKKNAWICLNWRWSTV